MANNPKQPLHSEILLKMRYFEKALSKALKKLTFFFLSKPVLFNGQSYQKQRGSETSAHSLSRSRNKFVKIILFVIILILLLSDKV